MASRHRVLLFLVPALLCSWRGVMSDLTQDCPNLTQLPGYQLVPGEHTGNDLLNVSPASLSLVAAICNATCNCLSFNSNGWVKNATDVNSHPIGIWAGTCLYVRLNPPTSCTQPQPNPSKCFGSPTIPGYNVVPGIHEGNDIDGFNSLRSRPATLENMQQLAAACNNSCQCRAFSTQGYLKTATSITPPRPTDPQDACVYVRLPNNTGPCCSAPPAGYTALLGDHFGDTLSTAVGQPAAACDANCNCTAFNTNGELKSNSTVTPSAFSGAATCLYRRDDMSQCTSSTTQFSVSLHLQFVTAQPDLASDTSLQRQFKADLKAAIASYFSMHSSMVKVVDLTVVSSNHRRLLQQGSNSVAMTLQVLVHLMGTTMEAQHVRLFDLQSLPMALMPDSMLQKYNISSIAVTDASLLGPGQISPFPPAASTTAPPSSHKVPVGGIVAAVCAGVAVIAVALFAGRWWWRRRSHRKHRKLSTTELSIPQLSSAVQQQQGLLQSPVFSPSAPVSTPGKRLGRQDSKASESSMVVVLAPSPSMASPKTEPLDIKGVAKGEPFRRGTAYGYSWASYTSVPGQSQAVECGINDTLLDTQVATSADGSSSCPVISLTKEQVKQQLVLHSNGLLGRGATALVFKCSWPSRFGPNAMLAVKVLKDGYEVDPLVLQSFAYEAGVLANTQHCNIIKLYGYCLEPPTVCLILELLPVSLKDVLYTLPPSTSTHSEVGQLTAGNSASSQVNASGNAASITSSTATATTHTGTSAPSATAPSHAGHSAGISQAEQSIELGTAVTSGPAGTAAASHSQLGTGFTAVRPGSVIVGNSTSSKPASLYQVVRISTDVAAGLAYLHELRAPVGAAFGELADRTARIVHRDLKPANILINSQGVAKISDFGLAREHQHTTIETVHLGAGTLPYMAPELLVAASSSAGLGLTVTNRVDIYSLAMIMWELLAGQPPWKGMSQTSILAAVVQRRRPPLPSDDVEDREHVTSHDAAGLTDMPAHGHPSLPKLNAIIRACWQHRELRRPTAAATHGMLAALLQELQQQQQ